MWSMTEQLWWFCIVSSETIQSLMISQTLIFLHQLSNATLRPSSLAISTLIMFEVFHKDVLMLGWLEFNVPFQHKYGYIRDEVYWLREWTFLCCFLPFSITDIAKCASHHSAPAVWYSLPRTVLHSPSLTVFKYGLKTKQYLNMGLRLTYWCSHNIRQWWHDLYCQCFWSNNLAAGQKCVYYHYLLLGRIPILCT